MPSFVSVHAAVLNLFRVGRHRLRAVTPRHLPRGGFRGMARGDWHLSWRTERLPQRPRPILRAQLDSADRISRLLVGLTGRGADCRCRPRRAETGGCGGPCERGAAVPWGSPGGQRGTPPRDAGLSTVRPGGLRLWDDGAQESAGEDEHDDPPRRAHHEGAARRDYGSTPATRTTAA